MAPDLELTNLKSLVEKQAERLRTLEHRLGTVEDIAKIRNLQHSYGYYIDKCHYNEVVDLFEEDCIVKFHGGIFKGKEGAKRLYVENFATRFVGGRNGPVKGFLLDHPTLQDVVTISPDRLSAKMRARTLMQAGRHRDYPADPVNRPTVPRQWWEGGIYENTYGRKNVDEPWKIRELNYVPIWHGDFSEGWSNAPENYVPHLRHAYPENPLGPDIVMAEKERWLWPDVHTIPYHYPHPITGNEVKYADMFAPDPCEVYDK